MDGWLGTDRARLIARGGLGRPEPRKTQAPTLGDDARAIRLRLARDRSGRPPDAAEIYWEYLFLSYFNYLSVFLQQSCDREPLRRSQIVQI